MKTLTTQELKIVAKSSKVKGWWKLSKEELKKEICKIKGWDKETPAVQEYLLAGGEIEKCPGFIAPAPRPVHSDSASIVVPGSKKTKKKPTKSAKASQETGDLVSLADICEELGVDSKVARKKLRKSDITKGDLGWKWNKDEVEIINKVREILGAK